MGDSSDPLPETEESLSFWRWNIGKRRYLFPQTSLCIAKCSQGLFAIYINLMLDLNLGCRSKQGTGPKPARQTKLIKIFPFCQYKQDFMSPVQLDISESIFWCCLILKSNVSLPIPVCTLYHVLELCTTYYVFLMNLERDETENRWWISREIDETDSTRTLHCSCS